MKVLLGLSGGIDSAVSGYLLKQQGHEVEGASMIIWNDIEALPESKRREGLSNSCFSADIEEKKRKTEEVAARLGIKLHFIDCSDVFRREVLDNFKSEYLHGRTPNPCIVCNRAVKFGAMLERARESGIRFDKAATGHYARIDCIGGRHCLRKAVDEKKDQSYFLYRLSQSQLSEIMFPLGAYHKSEIREIDLREGFHGERQGESQDFYDGPYSDLIGMKPQEGRIVDLAGNILGHHEGFWNYTIGQRRGLGVAAPRALYVLAIRPQANEVVVGYEEDADSDVVRAADVNWVSAESLEGRRGLSAKIRSTGRSVGCEAGFEDGILTARFVSPVKAPTPGQSLVLYDSDGYVICGGTII